MQIRKNIYKLLFISLFLAVKVCSYSQADTTYRATGIMFGVDLSRFFVKIWDPVQKNMEFSVNAEIRNNLYLTGEGGTISTLFDDKNYHYESQGNYFRLGMEYNLLKRAPGESYMLYGGLLYGFSSFSHQADYITITDEYWGTATGSLPETKLTGNWLEIKAGIRVNILKNIFLGWSLRTRFYLMGQTDPNMTPFLIPGFGKGDKNTTIGMSYSIFYRIPYKIKIR